MLQRVHSLFKSVLSKALGFRIPLMLENTTSQFESFELVL